jgi:hypothetical protein
VAQLPQHSHTLPPEPFPDALTRGP